MAFIWDLGPRTRDLCVGPFTWDPGPGTLYVGTRTQYLPLRERGTHYIRNSYINTTFSRLWFSSVA